MGLTSSPPCVCPHSQGLCGKPSRNQCVVCGKALCGRCAQAIVPLAWDAICNVCASRREG